MKSILLRISTHDFIKLLRDKPYVYFLLSVVFSQVAFNMMNVVLIFIVFTLTSSSFLVSMILLTALLPQVFLSFIGGIVADTRNKRKILVGGNIARALFILPLFFLNKYLVPIYILELFVSVATQFYVPAETPIIPKIVPEKLLIPANSLFGLALFGSILIGYVFAGPALLALGSSYVFVIIGFLYLFAGLFAYLIPSKILTLSEVKKYELREEVQKSFREYLTESYQLLRQTTDVAPSFILLILSQVVIMILATIVPGYAKDILHIEVENVSSYLFAPAAFGMIVAAFFVGSIFKNASRNKLMNLGVFLSGLILFLLPLMSKVTSREFVIFINSLLPSALRINVIHMVIILAFFAGVGNALIFIPSQATIQEKIPENFRSKIYGLLFAVTGVFSLFPIILVGGLADTIGVNSVLILLGILITFGGIAQFVLLKPFKKE